TYDQLARNPDDYKGEKAKFYGKVIQVIEGDSEIQIRLAVNDNYDKIILCGYNPSIVPSRILKDDHITVYGVSVGVVSYDSTLDGQITIPGMVLDKID
ncbi:MAG: toxin regulator, partial [Ruminococcus sp.]|nr:toxin regulator [Ruminococcus sp.]